MARQKFKNKKMYLPLVSSLPSAVHCACIIPGPDLSTGRNNCSAMKSNILLAPTRQFLKRYDYQTGKCGVVMDTF